jgi:hypothetical protein
MAKVQTIADWDGTSLDVENWNGFLSLIKESFPVGKLQISVTRPRKNKTTGQLGYFFGEVCAKALKGYQDLGYIINDKEDAYAMLAKHTNWTRKICDIDGVVQYEAPKSLRDASMEDAALFIDRAIIFCQTELHLDIQSPEEYKKKRKWQQKA